jgi:Zn-dependent protease with chaperone function
LEVVFAKLKLRRNQIKGGAMQGRFVLVAGLALGGCTDLYDAFPGDDRPSDAVPIVAPDSGPLLTPEQSVSSFVQVIERVEPVAEDICRARTRGVNCDIQIFVDSRTDLPPNAFQTIDKTGRPIVVFTVALIADARNADEIAFVMGHEAAHHIAGHIPRREESVQTSAILASVLAQASGLGPDAVRAATSVGAEFGARRYSKDYELEADALGTEIAYLAGYDPVRGAAFFSRLPDPGDKFLGSHPPNAQRQDAVRQTLAGLR